MDNIEESTSSFYLPDPIVKYGEITLEKDKDYKISYTAANTDVTIENDKISFKEELVSLSCTVIATITGMGDYMGEVAQMFTVTYSEG